MPFSSTPTVGSTYKVDAYISTIGFIVTGILWTTAHTLCRNMLPHWENFPRNLRNRMCVELAIIPVRIGLVYFTLPAVLSAFTPAENWGAVDTEKALIACSMMTGAYLFDLSIYRGDFLSTLHHCMGPALFLWIRISFSQFSSSDALVCRSLMMFVFFGAAVGGTAASAAVFLLRVGKKYLKKDALYQYFALCLAALTASTVISCYMNVLYFLHVWQDAFAHFGFALLLPVIWEGFECYLQWRWLFQFYVFEKKFLGRHAKGMCVRIFY